MPRIVPGGNEVFAPTVVVDGRVQGVWKRNVRSGKSPRAELNIEYFETVSRGSAQSLESPVKAYEDFLGIPVAIA